MTPNPRELFDLHGKVAIVTGASKGIGEAIARGLAAFGARVVLSSRKQENVEAAAKSIRDLGGEAIAVAAHMGDLAAIWELVTRTSDQFGGIDIVVNNAATNPVFGPLLQNDAGVYDKIMSVNVQGPLELAKLAHPHMKRRGGGSIINVSSVGGLRPEPLLGLYSVSKAALISLTKVMAQDEADDYCQAVAVHKDGIMGYTIQQYNTWQGRYSYTLLSLFAYDRFDLAGGAMTTVLTIVGLVAGWWFFLAYWLPDRALLLSLALTLSFIAGVPNLWQSIYWMNSNLNYVPPLILALVFAGWLLQRGVLPGRSFLLVSASNGD